MNKLHVFLLSLFFIPLTNRVSAQLVRPNVAAGYQLTDGAKSSVSHYYGSSFMLSANDAQRYGVQIGKLVFAPDDSYLRTGLFIEQVLFKHFNMAIGTVGYINLQNKGENPFGIYTHLGYEQSVSKQFNILVAYQSDFIFNRSFAMNSALMFGVGFSF